MYILKNVISLVVNRVEIRHVISLVVNRVEIRQEKRHVCVNVAYNRPKSEKSPVLAALTLAARRALPPKGQLCPQRAKSMLRMEFITTATPYHLIYHYYHHLLRTTALSPSPMIHTLCLPLQFLQTTHSLHIYHYLHTHHHTLYHLPIITNTNLLILLIPPKPIEQL